MDVGPAEGINTLRIVTYDTDVLMNGGKFFGDEVLGYVGILKLIDHDMLEFVLVFVQHIQVIAEKNIRLKK